MGKTCFILLSTQFSIGFCLPQNMTEIGFLSQEHHNSIPHSFVLEQPQPLLAKAYIE